MKDDCFTADIQHNMVTTNVLVKQAAKAACSLVDDLDMAEYSLSVSYSLRTA